MNQTSSGVAKTDLPMPLEKGKVFVSYSPVKVFRMLHLA